MKRYKPVLKELDIMSHEKEFINRIKKNIKNVKELGNGRASIIFKDNSIAQLDVHKHKISVLKDNGFKDAIAHDLRKANEDLSINVEILYDFLV